MASWVEAVERAYVAAATGSTVPYAESHVSTGRARAAVGAVASRYLAVGTPRTFGLIADPSTFHDALLSLEAHRTWFAPIEIRCAAMAAPATATVISELTTDSQAFVAAATSGRMSTVDEVLACDIVCVHSPLAIRAAQLRRGTHVNAVGEGVTIDDALRKIATIADEGTLGELAAGIVDGRQLDEITVFVAGDLGIAIGALGFVDD